MLRLTFFLVLVVGAHGAKEEGLPAPRPPTPRPQSTVWLAREPSAIERLVANDTMVARMVDRLVMAVNGETEIGAAWRQMVEPKDRVGIKVSATGGSHFSTHVAVIEALLTGLEKAGVERRSVIIWDRESADLKRAGFAAGRLGCVVRGIDPPRGWDREAPFAAPVLGKLIWGDLLFTEKSTKRRGKTPTEQDQLSSTSHLAAILSRDVTKVINVPVLSDSTALGVGGAIYNMTVPNVDNWRRFVSVEGGASDSLAELYADERVAPKIILHLMDGLTAQYAGGPEGNPNYAFAHATLYAAKDAVALDATALRRLESWRRDAKLPAIGKKATWLDAAGRAGLGAFEETAITLREVTAP